MTTNMTTTCMNQPVTTFLEWAKPYARYTREAKDHHNVLPRREILVGDALEQLKQLPSASVDCCITSPPYYLLRDYGVAGQLGLEDSVTTWADNLMAVLSEVGRVLKPTGSLWLNLGDSYSRALRFGAAPKSLLMAPERLVLAMVERGWVLRNKVIWAKPNPMPHSVADRLNTAYEPLYFLVQSPRYYFALDEIREPHRSARAASTVRPGKYSTSDRSWAGPLAGKNDGLVKTQANGRTGHPLGRNPGDVWTIATGGYRGAHFATFPEQLVRRPMLASCPERVCSLCRTPWARGSTSEVVGGRRPAGRRGRVLRYPARWEVVRRLGDLQPGCTCQAGWVPGVVIDPFFGAGTVGVVAERLGRDWVGIEINPGYANLARERIETARAQEGRAP